MAADQERADRIRALKKAHPEYTWEAIGDHVGVSMRAAQAWQETGGITYENAKKLAELWDEDLGYIMRGVRPGTPDLMGSLGESTQLDRVESKLDEIISRLRALEAGAQLGEFEHRRTRRSATAQDAPAGTSRRSRKTS